ncbi:hypothetical protein MKX01_034891, partial [Papaver californicum]
MVTVTLQSEKPHILFTDHCTVERMLHQLYVQLATREVVKDSMCLNSKEAIMYYNGCVLRYSDKYYFSIMQETPAIQLINQNNVTNPDIYLTLVTGLLDKLIIEAVTNTTSSPSLFSTGASNYTRRNKIYGMVQCTPDLTHSISATCLRSAIRLIKPERFNGWQGRRVLYPSCTFRYEIYPFYGQSIYATTQALPPTPYTLKRTFLDWEMRYRIIRGIARDFGMARLFLIDQTQANTKRIVGTYGYMASEHAFQGQFSVKSDVFSFGVLILEILSGKKNTSFYESDTDILAYAWRHWENGSALDLLDASFKENCSRSKVMR